LRTYGNPAVYLLIGNLGESYVCHSQKRSFFPGTGVPSYFAGFTGYSGGPDERQARMESFHDTTGY